MNWFTVKVKYTKQTEDGRFQRVTEPYLIDAASFTDAEARIYKEVGEYIRGEFLITGISKTEFADIFYYEDSEDWYKCKVSYVSYDPDSEKEKKITNNFLVTAKNVKEAFDRIKESLSDMTVSFEIPSIMLTSIVEVIPYDGESEASMEKEQVVHELDTEAVVSFKDESEEE
ncbi:MAG: DUF4494 domain-containing protein [Brumimicrobium sp.]|nr:DUF4494 domain-containing protein [Brumimicrobium sp.]